MFMRALRSQSVRMQQICYKYKKKIVTPPAAWFNVSRWFHDIETLPYIGRDYGFLAPSLTTRLALNDHWICWICSKITWSLVLVSRRNTQEKYLVGTGPTILFGVPGITGHRICWTRLDKFDPPTPGGPRRDFRAYKFKGPGNFMNCQEYILKPRLHPGVGSFMPRSKVREISCTAKKVNILLTPHPTSGSKFQSN